MLTFPERSRSLLPKGVVNRERLAGAGLDDLVVRAIELTIKRQWQQIGAEDQAGRALAVLRQHYAIRRSQVSDHISVVLWTRFPTIPQISRPIFKPMCVARAFQPIWWLRLFSPLRNGNAVGIDKVFPL